MLKKEGKITDAVIENMLSWRHSGFHVYIGDRIFSDDQTGLGNLARYIIRPCFSQERMVYIPKLYRGARHNTLKGRNLKKFCDTLGFGISVTITSSGPPA